MVVVGVGEPKPVWINYSEGALCLLTAVTSARTTSTVIHVLTLAANGAPTPRSAPPKHKQAAWPPYLAPTCATHSPLAHLAKIWPVVNGVTTMGKAGVLMQTDSLATLECSL